MNDRTRPTLRNPRPPQTSGGGSAAANGSGGIRDQHGERIPAARSAPPPAEEWPKGHPYQLRPESRSERSPRPPQNAEAGTPPAPAAARTPPRSGAAARPQQARGESRAAAVPVHTQSKAVEAHANVVLQIENKVERAGGIVLDGTNVLSGESVRIALMSAEQAAELMAPHKGETYEQRLGRAHASFAQRSDLENYQVGAVAGFDGVYRIGGSMTLEARWARKMGEPNAPYQAIEKGVLQAFALSPGFVRVAVVKPGEAVPLSPDHVGEVARTFDPLALDGVVQERKIGVAVQDRQGRVSCHWMIGNLARGDDGRLFNPVTAELRQMVGLSRYEDRVDLPRIGSDVREDLGFSAMRLFVYEQTHKVGSAYAAGAIIGAMSEKPVEEQLERLRFDRDLLAEDKVRILDMARGLRSGDLRAVVVPGSIYGVYRSVAEGMELKQRGLLTAGGGWFPGAVGVSSAYMSGSDLKKRSDASVHALLPEDPRLVRMLPGKDDAEIAAVDTSLGVRAEQIGLEAMAHVFGDRPVRSMPSVQASSGMDR